MCIKLQGTSSHVYRALEAVTNHITIRRNYDCTAWRCGNCRDMPFTPLIESPSSTRRRLYLEPPYRLQLLFFVRRPLTNFVKSQWLTHTTS